MLIQIPSHPDKGEKKTVNSLSDIEKPNSDKNHNKLIKSNSVRDFVFEKKELESEMQSYIKGKNYLTPTEYLNYISFSIRIKISRDRIG